ncbi:hypothetical protein C2I06_18325 [Niallia circulans]|uniref:DUF4179 domain-containing protein n=1 Tax=Niallia circulans TaxID=1397 RepID=UPI0002E91B98|nr:DUF4179 domain-containing protein [Niallia circulans]AYV68678.1 hypothetical protein C2I06_18325 [Niallia circulans]
MKKEKILKHLDKAIEKQVPDVWDEIETQIHKAEELGDGEKVVRLSNVSTQNKKVSFYKRISLAAVVCLIVAITFTFTPVLATIQEVYEKIFSSKHIDDTGVRTAVNLGNGQAVDQTFYDEKHDITVHFDRLMTDEKETKLLLTYQSDKTDLKNFYIDLFEGESSINLIVGNERKKLASVGWGSRYYDSKKNKVAEALSFASIKEYEGQDIRLEIENLSIYDNEKETRMIQTIWPIDFKLSKSAISDREIVEVNKQFTFRQETYKIKQVEFSPLETRVVVIIPPNPDAVQDKDGSTARVMSKLEHKFLDARKIDKEYGYIVDKQKSGVFLKSAGERVDPIFSKGEVEGTEDEYIMIFAPVKNPQDCILEIGDDIKIPLIGSGTATIEKQSENSEKQIIDAVLAENGYAAEPLSHDEMKEMDLYLKKYQSEFPIDRTAIGKLKGHENSKLIEVAISQTSEILTEIQAGSPEEAEKARKEDGLSFIPIYLTN